MGDWSKRLTRNEAVYGVLSAKMPVLPMLTDTSTNQSPRADIPQQKHFPRSLFGNSKQDDSNSRILKEHKIKGPSDQCVFPRFGSHQTEECSSMQHSLDLLPCFLETFFFLMTTSLLSNFRSPQPEYSHTCSGAMPAGPHTLPSSRPPVSTTLCCTKVMTAISLAHSVSNRKTPGNFKTFFYDATEI